MRLWLPDRPGALGQVATRIGAVQGEIVGIDILERGGGRAIDELVVDLPDASLVELLVHEVRQVDGVAVEEVRPVVGALHDARLDALETAAILVGASERSELVSAVVEHARRTMGGEWAAVISLDDVQVEGEEGPVPPVAWLKAFVEGSRTSARVVAGETGPDDVVWAPMPAAALVLLIGRRGLAYRARERRQVAALARIVDTRLRELTQRVARLQHPSIVR